MLSFDTYTTDAAHSVSASLMMFLAHIMSILTFLDIKVFGKSRCAADSTTTVPVCSSLMHCFAIVMQNKSLPHINWKLKKELIKFFIYTWH